MLPFSPQICALQGDSGPSRIVTLSQVLKALESAGLSTYSNAVADMFMEKDIDTVLVRSTARLLRDAGVPPASAVGVRDLLEAMPSVGLRWRETTCLDRMLKQPVLLGDDCHLLLRQHVNGLVTSRRRRCTRQSFERIPSFC